MTRIEFRTALIINDPPRNLSTMLLPMCPLFRGSTVVSAYLRPGPTCEMNDFDSLKCCATMCYRSENFTDGRVHILIK